jgi:branched-chain amino acid transport system ATP-binding protein
MLAIEGLTQVFGGVVALDAVSLEVAEHSITALVGPNGAGKTTLFNIVAGAYPPTAGTVRLGGRSLNGLPAHARVGLGIGRTFQNALLFDKMTVLENVMVGRHARSSQGMLAAALRLPAVRAEEERIFLAAMRCLNLVGLGMHAHTPAGSLPFGQQRLAAIARALATEPKLLLMDEPAAGLNTLERQGLADLIRTIREMGITVLLVEHDMTLVMQLAEWVVVLDHGRKLAEGTGEQIRKNRQVIAAYLGAEAG